MPLVFGQELRPIPIAEILDTHRFAQRTPLQFSPDGRWLVYTRQDSRRLGRLPATGSSAPEFEEGIDLCLINVETGDSRVLSEGVGSNWSPAWSPDGRLLAFLSDRDGSGKAKLWTWELATGQMRKVSDLSLLGDEVQWLPNGQQVLVAAWAEGVVQNEISSPRPVESRLDSRTSLPGSTAIVYRSEAAATAPDLWDLESSRRDLALVDVLSGKVQRIDRGHRIVSFTLSPDGSHVAYTSAKRFERAGSQQILFDMTVLTVSTGQSRTVGRDLRFGAGGNTFTWSPDGGMLAYEALGFEANGDCFVVDIAGGAPRNLTNFPPGRVGGFAPVWDSSGHRLYFIRSSSLWTVDLEQTGPPVEFDKVPNRQVRSLILDHSGTHLWLNRDSTVVVTYDDSAKRSGFYRLNLIERTATRLLESDQCLLCVNSNPRVAVTPDNSSLVYIAMDAQHDADLWLSDRDFRDQHRLTRLNSQFDRYQMGQTQLVEWRSLDGETLHGALLLPAGYEKGKRYPLVVHVYGGSMLSNDVNRFGLGGTGFANMQMFATRGYAVLEPDAPQHMGTPMVDLAKTILPGVDKVIDMGIGDGARLGVWGHSYGGYTTLSLIVQTNRFKAAVSIDGYGDNISSYGVMDNNGYAFQTSIAEKGQGLLGGTPWEARDRFIENSPIFYLDRVKTPLLLIHGGDDEVLPPFLSGEVFVGLRRLGKQAEYVKYDHEGHSPLYWSEANQVDLCTRLVDWFDRYLKQ